MERTDSSRVAHLHHEMIMAGFGGQGVLKMGQTLAEAAVLAGYEVVWTPAYGPEMRGGPAFCTVIISSERIGSPVISHVDTAMIMDLPSLPKYQTQVRAEGILLLNSSLVDPSLARKDVLCYAIRANHLAEDIGEAGIANMVMLGAYLRVTHLLSTTSIIQALQQTLPAHRRHLIPQNEVALRAGAAEVERCRQQDVNNIREEYSGISCGCEPPLV